MKFPSQVFPNPVGEEWTSLHTYRTTLDPDSADPGLGVSATGHEFAGATGANISSLGPSTGPGHSGTTGRSGGPGRGRGRRQNRESDLSIRELTLHHISIAPSYVRQATILTAYG